MKAQDALYLEAEQVYRAFSRERERLFRAGAPADAGALAFTQGRASESLKKAHEEGPQLVGGAITMAWVTRNAGLSREGSVVSLTGCTDASSTILVLNGKKVGAGPIVQERVYFGGVPGSLTMVYAERKPVETCAR